MALSHFQQTHLIGFDSLYPSVFLMDTAGSEEVAAIVGSDVKAQLIKLVQLHRNNRAQYRIRR